jgi:hypothetical protein
MLPLTDQLIDTFKDTARKLTGANRRGFQARITRDFLDGNARQAESIFGWFRGAVALGLTELRTGII